MTESDLARLDALLAAATPGPWRNGWDDPDDPPGTPLDYDAPVVYREGYREDPSGMVVYATWYDGPLTACESRNAALIAGAVNALPSLLADSRALREAVGLLREYRAGPLDLDDRIDAFLARSTP